MGEGLYRLVNGYSFQALDNANGAEEHPVIQPGQTYGYKFRIQGPSNVSH